MNEFFKFLGVIVVLAGVVVLAVSAFTHSATNTMLTLGGVLMIVGLIIQIIIPKFIIKD